MVTFWLKSIGRRDRIADTDIPDTDKQRLSSSLSTMPECPYCAMQATSEAGLKSHTTQSKACLEKLLPSLNDPLSDVPMADAMHSDFSNNDNFNMDLDEVPPDPIRGPPRRRSVSIEEVEDEETPSPQAPQFFDDFPGAAEVLGEAWTSFEELRQGQLDRNEEPWGPFENEEEWELARWIMRSGVSQSHTDTLLKLPIVCT